MGKDGNENMFSIALALVEAESDITAQRNARRPDKAAGRLVGRPNGATGRPVGNTSAGFARNASGAAGNATGNIAARNDVPIKEIS
ncbi:hypothetical protein ACH5RR_029868 [Cinchona calisaya]|uniref:Uncharacterized protein n=1 Tax=Cinchona calisaya TaxID=153742 RepID=A0ABD2YXA0_9GENT